MICFVLWIILTSDHIQIHADGLRITESESYLLVQVWSYLLGVGVTSGKSFKKVTVFPGTPAIYQKVSTGQCS